MCKGEEELDQKRSFSFILQFRFYSKSILSIVWPRNSSVLYHPNPLNLNIFTDTDQGPEGEKDRKKERG